MAAERPVGPLTGFAMWQTLGDEPLRYRCWEGDYVVYNPFSGHTHQLDIAAGRMLELLIDGPKDSETLYRELSQYLEAQDEDIFRSSIDSVLEVLSELGLIENVSEK